MFLPDTLPTLTPIAADLHTMMEWGRDWLDPNVPYHGYPPLSNMFFAALYPLPFNVTYAIFAAMAIGTLLVLLAMSLHRQQDGRIPPLLALFVITGLSSYGLQFELERGQFNLLAFGLSVGGVWLFHAKPRWTLLAYALFCAGVQLKLYPAILILLLTRDYRDFKGNLRRAAGLAAANFLLLLALGLDRFSEFVTAVQVLATGFGGSAINHSIYSFARVAVATLSPYVALPAYTLPTLQWTLTLAMLASLAVIVWLNYRDRRSGYDPYLLLACTIGAMVIPSVSFDYKLSILIAPTALAVVEFEQRAVAPSHPRTAGIAALVLLIAAYTTTLFSFYLKPTALDNNCPALFVMLGCVTALAWMRSTAVSRYNA
jgi:hypothetical protein